ncbi:unnamed protein product [Cyprideis torosa]|uniref:Uncharacterized protein n=1 Tax=Cyprideis torosa TaxID=163714 RepID=A0A7R8W4M5_9CRUS|nr:unnamed protein product [Cyprideis torosa]CAG0880805.1 unnamed protein product [Cyprideis torosa]
MTLLNDVLLPRFSHLYPVRSLTEASSDFELIGYTTAGAREMRTPSDAGEASVESPPIVEAKSEALQKADVQAKANGQLRQRGRKKGDVNSREKVYLWPRKVWGGFLVEKDQARWLFPSSMAHAFVVAQPCFDEQASKWDLPLAGLALPTEGERDFEASSKEDAYVAFATSGRQRDIHWFCQSGRSTHTTYSQQHTFCTHTFSPLVPLRLPPSHPTGEEKVFPHLPKVTPFLSCQRGNQRTGKHLRPPLLLPIPFLCRQGQGRRPIDGRTRFSPARLGRIRAFIGESGEKVRCTAFIGESGEKVRCTAFTGESGVKVRCTAFIGESGEKVRHGGGEGEDLTAKTKRNGVTVHSNGLLLVKTEDLKSPEKSKVQALLLAAKNNSSNDLSPPPSESPLFNTWSSGGGGLFLLYGVLPPHEPHREEFPPDPALCYGFPTLHFQDLSPVGGSTPDVTALSSL